MSGAIVITIRLLLYMADNVFFNFLLKLPEVNAEVSPPSNVWKTLPTARFNERPASQQWPHASSHYVADDPVLRSTSHDSAAAETENI